MATYYPQGQYSGDSYQGPPKKTNNFQHLKCDILDTDELNVTDLNVTNIVATDIETATFHTTDGAVTLGGNVPASINEVRLDRGIPFLPIYDNYLRLTDSALFPDNNDVPVVFDSSSSEIVNRFNGAEGLYTTGAYNVFHSETINPTRFVNPFKDKYCIFDISYNVTMYAYVAGSVTTGGPPAVVWVRTNDPFDYLWNASYQTTHSSYNASGQVKLAPNGYFQLYINKRTLNTVPPTINYHVDVKIDLSVKMLAYSPL